ncbi:uncharacterized protein MONOS_12075 [Monocercomonoides exilis]|uniref:uncharacterized protein n=1 Tax=Monocercomonoides exilis TaxID=2049356 RepID=UPI00355A8215|nr:hypothetical protein MONOS_12075 [Monocercomonoides exilis]|eukprot:MONOS_12075.1-p1 / transcript=MONOS_12075.1 / gene=MONOS_12075 / organism=Monocercomonoides_exilis_PA203 / gene_product=unspecified product / transcript_product=unspecified product / location=Mono_scaffold00643:7999-8747(+) / protein_length=226 / sequence_SO=supercontig / SO=protein_coding / is_pseudo=false
MGNSFSQIFRNPAFFKKKHALRSIELRYFFLLYGKEGLNRFKHKDDKKSGDFEECVQQKLMEFDSYLNDAPFYLYDVPKEPKIPTTELIGMEQQLHQFTFMDAIQSQQKPPLAMLCGEDFDIFLHEHSSYFKIQDDKITQITQFSDDFDSTVIKIELLADGVWQLNAKCSTGLQINEVDIPQGEAAAIPQDAIITIKSHSLIFHYFVAFIEHLTYHSHEENLSEK